MAQSLNFHTSLKIPDLFPDFQLNFQISTFPAIIDEISRSEGPPGITQFNEEFSTISLAWPDFFYGIG